MNTVEEVYGARFFKNRHKLAWRAPIVCNAIAEILKLKPGASIIDVGCATGDLVAEYVHQGYDAWGIEGSSYALEFVAELAAHRIKVRDMRKPLNVKDFNIPYDMAMSLEVAEHLEEEYADTFVFNLCTLSNTIVLSAAPPGQRGHGHVNCQEPDYWKDLFDFYGYGYDGTLTYSIKSKWMDWRKKSGIKAYFDNLMVFQKRK